MEKVGRNDTCPFGSGKKYKNCHMKAEETKGGWNKAYLIGLILAVLLIIGVVGAYINSQKGQGPAPPGKVWSEEHQHYH